MKDDDDDDEDVNNNDNDEPEFPPLYDASTAAEDYDKAGDCKQQAADFQAAGDWEAALTKYNEAVLAAPPSALLYANRANALLKLGRPRAAERDCDLALAENPDSAKVNMIAFECLFCFTICFYAFFNNTLNIFALYCGFCF